MELDLMAKVKKNNKKKGISPIMMNDLSKFQATFSSGLFHRELSRNG
jgi:hypothetical protein